MADEAVNTWALPLGDHPTRSELDAPTTLDGWVRLLDDCIATLPLADTAGVETKLRKLRRVLTTHDDGIAVVAELQRLRYDLECYDNPVALELIDRRLTHLGAKPPR